jgi:hypothetical protein
MGDYMCDGIIWIIHLLQIYFAKCDRQLWAAVVSVSVDSSGWTASVDLIESAVFVDLPRSNMHGRKRPFTVKNGDIRRSYTVSVHGHRIRSETVRNGFRIRRLYKNTEWFEGKVLYSVYGAIRLPYTVVYYRVQSHMVVYGYNMRHFSDSHWKWVSI